MEYQKIINLLDKTPNQPTIFRTKNSVEINHKSRGGHKKDNQIRFKTSVLQSSSCDYTHAYILVKGTMTVAQATAAASNNATKKVILKNCAPFTKCISRIKNKQVDNAHDIEVVMPMHNLIEYSDNYWKTSGILWQYCRDELTLNAAGDAIADFTVDNAITDLFKIKQKITHQAGGNRTKKLMVPLKYLSNFWRNLEIHLINCETNLDLNWSKNCVIVANNSDKATNFQ